MGLDMYLKGKKYIGNWDEQEKKVSDKVKQVFPELADFGKDVWVDEVSVQVGYWRKANAIHRWFVENVQNDEDDCGTYYVSKSDLTKLKELCLKVLADKEKAPVFLPTQPGFFFGSTEYGNYYFEDLENTVKMIDNAFKLDDSWSLEYRSSW